MMLPGAEKIAGKMLRGCADQMVSTGIAGEIRATNRIIVSRHSSTVRLRRAFPIDQGSFFPAEILNLPDELPPDLRPSMVVKFCR
jgi:hypothetical protein